MQRLLKSTDENHVSFDLNEIFPISGYEMETIDASDIPDNILSEILIDENSIITDNQIKRASNYGMPVKNSNNYGDLIIIYKLIYPKMLLEKNDINKLFEINDDDNLEDNKLKKIKIFL